MSAASTTVRRAPDPAEMYQRIGELTRRLHDAMQQLGYDKQIEASLGSVPDARSRLSFIAKVTGDAAERVLNTVDASQAEQAALMAEADRMEALLKSDPVGAVARGEVLHFIAHARENSQRTNDRLTDIMMAQDFQDLTGQVITKVTKLGHSMESQLVQLLIEYAPVDGRRDSSNSLVNGPQVNPEGKTDVVADQEQVDDLLESLGF